MQSHSLLALMAVARDNAIVVRGSKRRTSQLQLYNKIEVEW